MTPSAILWPALSTMALQLQKSAKLNIKIARAWCGSTIHFIYYDWIKECQY